MLHIRPGPNDRRTTPDLVDGVPPGLRPTGSESLGTVQLLAARWER